MSETIINLIVENLCEIVFAIIGVILSALFIPWLKNTAIPWLKDKQLFSTVYKFVQAAEKLAESGQIPLSTKKQYVISLLKKKGIILTEEVDALIESAVEQLDINVSSGLNTVIKALADADTDSDTKSEDSESSAVT